MRFLPKKHFQWREPRAFLKRNYAFERSRLHWWTLPLCAVIATVMLLLSWYMAGFNPHSHRPPQVIAIPLAFGGGLFFSYGIPWMNSFGPSEIRLYDNFLTRARGNNYLKIKYAEIAAFTWRENGDLGTLILKYGRKHQVLFIGIPPETPEETVTQFLLDRQITQQHQNDEPVAHGGSAR